MPGMTEAARGGERVVLAHGLWMGKTVWLPLACRLRGQGFDVAAFSYPSVRQGLEASARALEAFARAQRAHRLHFIGHSLGGLVVLRMLCGARDLPVGRVVLLGTPVAGCLAAQQLGRSTTGRMLRGAALPQWRPEHADAVLERVEVAAIAGTRRFGLAPLFVQLPAPNDGAVTVDETRLPRLADHLVLPVTHTGLIMSRRVAREVIAFLRNGRFAG